MGLDMYLEKAKRIGNVTPGQLLRVNEYFSYLNRSEDFKDSTMKEWCGIHESEVNMERVKAYESEYIHRYASWDNEKKYGWKTIFETIADWRKANHIHKWFVDNVQNGVDDCGTYEVTKEQLEELLDICKKVINGSNLVKGKIVNGQTFENGKWVDDYVDGEYIEDSSVAEKLLPTTSGFFFGGTQYDQWYIRDVEYTIEVIENTLNTTNFEHEIVMYSSSW
jgi:hypothetical protein